MTEAIWIAIGAAVAATGALVFAGIFLSDRSAKRIDRLRANSRQRQEVEAEADRLLKANLINTQR